MTDWAQYADRLAKDALAEGDPTAWFDRLYAAAESGAVSMPWNRDQANPLLVQWADEHAVAGDGRRAVVVGCGLGEEAEFVARLGFATVAFDISETAIRIAQGRHPGSPVTYRTADLLHAPPEWSRAFDLVVEIYTVQALPRTLRARATAAVAELVAPGGVLVVVSMMLGGRDPALGPPWPLTRAEAEAFATDGLSLLHLDEVTDPVPHWRLELRRDRADRTDLLQS